MSRFGNLPFFEELRREINTDKFITRVIIISVLMFAALNLIMVIAMIITGDKGEARYYEQMVEQWIALPANPRIFITRPWTIITYIFTHFSVSHLLFNMLGLFWFGSLLHEYIGIRKLIPLFFYAGVAGGILFMVTANIMPFMDAGGAAIGASASVLAIIAAAATLLPDHEFRLLLIGNVKLKYLAIGLVILDILLLHDDNTGGHFAHLGGALFGFIYIRQMKVGHDLSRPFNAVKDFFTGLPGRFRKRKQPHMVYKRGDKAPMQGTKADRNKQEQVDALLDKINRSGYESLTKEEKAFLFRASKDE